MATPGADENIPATIADGGRSMRSILIRAFMIGTTMMGTADVGRAQGTEVGKYHYMNSCAPCHGVSGKGDGAVARSLKLTPADLTKLSEVNNGVFPFSRIYEVIDGRFEVEAHGKRDMPIWGEIYKPTWNSLEPPVAPVFSKEVAESVVRGRILALIEYISTLQGR
jgi:mono/diheme cytochrome c family protein